MREKNINLIIFFKMFILKKFYIDDIDEIIVKK